MQYFSYIRHNSTAPDAFAEVVKVTTHTVDSQMPSSPGHASSIEVLETWAKFLESSAYCTVIKCTFTFCTTNIFGCFHSISASFEPVKYKYLNYTVAHLFGFTHHTQSEVMHNISAQKLPWYYQPKWVPTMVWTALFVWYTCWKIAPMKIMQNLPK